MYPIAGGEPIRYDLVGRDGGIIRVPFGKYTALCVSGDTETLSERNIESPYTFEVITKTTSLLSSLSVFGVQSTGAPRANGTENETISMSPEAFWYDVVEGIELTIDQVDDSITLYPEETYCTYDVEIRNASNLKYVNGVSFSLSSLAAGIRVYDNVLAEDLVTIPFEGFFNLDTEIITGNMLTFGHCPTTNRTHHLMVYAVLMDGTKWYYTYDVTDQINTAPDQRNIHIILDGLPIPKPISNGGGLQPIVEEWVTVEIELDM